MPALIGIGLIILILYLIIKLIIWLAPYVATGFVFVIAAGCVLGLLVGIFYAVKNYMASILENIHSGVLKVTMMFATSVFVLIFLAASVFSYGFIEEYMVYSHKNSGIESANQHEFEVAIKHFTKAIKGVETSKNTLALHRKAFVARLTGTPTINVPDSTLARVYELRGRARMASLSRSVTILNNDFSDMLVVQSELNNEKNFILDQAIDDFSIAIKRDPEKAVLYRERCRAYDWKNYNDKAIDDCNNAIRINPNYALAYNNLGQLYTKKSNYDQAIKCYSSAIDIDPKFIPAYYNRGELYAKNNKYDNAIADFETVLRINPNENGVKERLNAVREAKQKQQRKRMKR